ncbi:MAG: phenylalanine--tRNA ligase subunit beta, partial [Nanoarchaeota archaeon]
MDEINILKNREIFGTQNTEVFDVPTISLDKKRVTKGLKLKDKELAERISMMGTDLDEITSTSIDVEIFPNRPDLLSEQGFARALSSFAGVDKGLRKYSAKKSGFKLIIDSSVKDVRPYTACAVVKNFKFSPDKIDQVIKIQEKLHVTYGRNRKKAAIGIYPLEKIKFPIYFKAAKDIKFRPLESDKEMTASEILSDHPTGKEYGHLLAGVDKYPYFVDSNDEILSMPPIINSYNTGRITGETSAVFIECSGFDHDVLSKCLNMIVCALADDGGEIYEIEVENKHLHKKYVLPELAPTEMKIDIDYVNKRLGLSLKDVKPYLEKMGYGYEKSKVLVPCYRADILSQSDLVEDIAIAYGFENFNAIIPKVSTVGEEDSIEKFKSKLTEVLVGLGMHETMTYNISSSASQSTLMNSSPDLVMLANSLTTDYDCLRYWVIPSLMEVLRWNRQHEYPQKFFDFGRIFKKG